MKGDFLLSKKDELEYFLSINIFENVDILPPEYSNTKDVKNVLKGVKKRQLNNNRRKQDFARLVSNLHIMIVEIALPKPPKVGKKSYYEC
ncbi:hypothetical protein S83_038613 [Arachis hypogaea]